MVGVLTYGSSEVRNWRGTKVRLTCRGGPLSAVHMLFAQSRQHNRGGPVDTMPLFARTITSQHLPVAIASACCLLLTYKKTVRFLVVN